MSATFPRNVGTSSFGISNLKHLILGDKDINSFFTTKPHYYSIVSSDSISCKDKEGKLKQSAGLYVDSRNLEIMGYQLETPADW